MQICRTNILYTSIHFKNKQYTQNSHNKHFITHNTTINTSCSSIDIALVSPKYRHRAKYDVNIISQDIPFLLYSI